MRASLGCEYLHVAGQGRIGLRFEVIFLLLFAQQ